VTDKFILPVFWALVGVFILVAIAIAIAMLFIPPEWEMALSPWIVIIPTTVIFFLLGLTLLILVARASIGETFKKFLILTGASTVGFIVSFILHNLISGLFSQWFGGDEPFFFMMAVFVCPIAYLVGTVGSIVLIIRRKIYKTSTL